jgi:uncharacterized delta-60 repeat protein
MRPAALLLLASLCAPPLLADGMLDPDFGTGGRVTTSFGMFWMDDAAALVLQPDGRAIAAGRTFPNLAQSFMAAARYLPSGALDTTFDGDGLVTVDFSSAPDRSAIATNVLLQPDGKIVLVGSFSDSPVLRYALARLNADGTLDSSFGTGGKVTVPLTNGLIAGSSAALLPDGRILVHGRTGSLSVPGLALARFNADGTLDATFGTAGQTTVPLPAPFAPQRLLLQPDGRILIAGFTASTGAFDFGLVRLLATGAPDPSFDGDGLATSDFGGNEFGSALALLADGRILVGGSRSVPTRDLAVVRYLANGALDTTFGTGGLATADSGEVEAATELLVQPDGKLMVLASTESSSGDFLLARFTGAGAHDTTFGTGGFLVTDFGGFDQGRAAAFAGPDRILAAGSTQSAELDFALARYIASTPVEALSFSVE